MPGFRRQCIRFLHFLRGENIYTHRDQAIRWLTLLAITVLVFTILFEGIVILTSPQFGGSDAGVALVIRSPTLGATDTPAGTPTPQPTPTSFVPVWQNSPNFSHIFEIVLENTSSNRLLGNAQAPYLNSLASRYALATNFYAVTHPSLPNYFVLTAGTTFGVTGDCADLTPSCQQNAPNLADEIEQSGRTWVAYFDAMPTPCGQTGQLPYTIHYNPFVYYADIVNNPQRCQSHIFPYNQTQFFKALSANRVPNYVWLSPSLYYDMHEGYSTIAQSDGWLAANVSRIIASPAFRQNGLLIITFDEGDDAGTPDTGGCCGDVPGGGHIVTLFISPLVKKGYQSLTYANHYNLLRTIEEAWKLPFLGYSKQVPAMSDFFP